MATPESLAIRPHESSNPGLQVLQPIPASSRIPAHSIIAVEGDGPKEQGNDGVVAYTSAHIDEAVSELVVRSSHSVQGNPQAIEEVRRILLGLAAVLSRMCACSSHSTESYVETIEASTPNSIGTL